ncbi:alpha-6-galactosyltransferase [Hordeum vulgare]|nr:alpha-6-galactosyltransferase [Hordeum vulgare]
MGPDSPDYERWGAVLTSTFRDKLFNESDDQSALVYMLQHKGSPWRGKVFLENSYYLQGYWVEIVGRLGGIAARYEAMERRAPTAALLRRRHTASWEHEGYAQARKAALAGAGLAESGVNGWRRPFVTHFTGCQPCSDDRNRDYSGDSCGDRNRDYSGDSCERLGEHVELPGGPANSQRRQEPEHLERLVHEPRADEVGDDDGVGARVGERALVLKLFDEMRRAMLAPDMWVSLVRKSVKRVKSGS